MKKIILSLLILASNIPGNTHAIAPLQVARATFDTLVESGLLTIGSLIIRSEIRCGKLNPLEGPVATILVAYSGMKLFDKARNIAQSTVETPQSRPN